MTSISTDLSHADLEQVQKPLPAGLQPTGHRPAMPTAASIGARGGSVLRRVVDLIAGLALLILVLPVIVATAVVLRVVDGPQVLYRQTRVGYGGRPFRMYKFRSMVPGADQLVIDLRDCNEADGLLFKIRHDPRVTPLGRHLRMLAIDELPQLWNVIRGDMSLVGPRPALPGEVALYDERIARRLHVKPGLTGLWQVNGRHELSFDDYVRYDLHYVDHHSPLLDLKIVLQTIPALLNRRGAH
jgi:lipopolysaccharide/colanic/teichoic acid biosynthesis glycosyltransferase